MRFPWWKRALSYLKPLPLRSLVSEKNGPMQLSLHRGELYLTAAHAVYSFGKHYNSFGNVFRRLDLYRNHGIRRVLVLGWGMGAIADLLDGHPSVEVITAVEHDSILTDAWREFHADPYSFRVDLHCADAIAWTGTCERQFDLICSDIFLDNTTPEAIVGESYISALNRLLLPGGTALLSKLNLRVEDAAQNQRLEQSLRALGIGFGTVNSQGNRVYHWSAPADEAGKRQG